MTNEELVVQIQAGIDVQENMGQLWEQLSPVIDLMAKDFKDTFELDDIRQEAYFTLVDAVKGFNPEGENSKMEFFFRYLLRRSLNVARAKENYGRLTNINTKAVLLIVKYKQFETTYRKEHNDEPPKKEDFIKALDISEVQLSSLEQHIRNGSGIGSLDEAVTDDENVILADTIQSSSNVEAEIIDSVMFEEGKKALWNAVDSLNDQESAVIRRLYQDELSIKSAAESLSVPERRVHHSKETALKKLRRNDQACYAAEMLGYRSSTAYKYSLQRFKDTNTSSTEFLALKHIEMEERISKLNERLHAYA